MEMETYVHQRETLEISMSNVIATTKEKAQREKIKLILEYNNEISKLKGALKGNVEEGFVEIL
eukprot:59886-Ditylum_brightwellii.AAC.1